jgi:lysozyme
MKLNKEGINLMHKFESCSLNAYLCPAKIPTIGWGNTYYEDGKKVKIGDKITQERANQLFMTVATDFAKRVRTLLKKTLTENQFSALVCFTYNVGVANLNKSTLLKKVNVNPLDLTIKDEFLKWVNKGSSFEKGLTRRRNAEVELYFKP